MALDDLSLSLMAFPQRWIGATSKLQVNVLLLPVGDPTAPLGTGPRFAGTSVRLIARIVAGLGALPKSTTPADFSFTLTATPPQIAPRLFAILHDQFAAKGIAVTSGKVTTAPTDPVSILKALPPSYLQAFPFEGPRNDQWCKVGDEYCCALREQAPKDINDPNRPKPDKTIAWGQILSYAMRQPVLAHHLGLIHRVTLDLPAGLLTHGGHIYFALDAGDPWASAFPGKPDAIRSYAARLPELAATEQRPLFAAKLFPVVPLPSSNLATAQLEAEEYDDGFAQIVHANQPETIDAATLRTDQITPATEAGIQLGWDDEQVTIWLNNQVGLLHDRVKKTSNNAEAPLGVQGYRADVRLKGDTLWNSLCVVSGTLPFDETSSAGGARTSIDGQELWISPAPVRPGEQVNSTNAQPAWLPLYFAQWPGSSLVLPDPVVQLLAYAVKAASTPAVADPIVVPPLPNPAPDLTAVPPLRYGSEYEFRVRLVDLTGGGPGADDPAIHPGPAPTAQIGFRRLIPPKALEVEALPKLPPLGEPQPASRTINFLNVRRPRIGYPEAIFAGVDPSTFEPSNLAPLIQEAWASGRPISVPDPDVDRIVVRVEARIPAHDSGTAGIARGDLDGDFRIVYSVTVPFPGDAADDNVVALDFTYVNAPDIAKMTLPAAGEVRLPIPTARDVRVRLYPQCAKRPDYYGTDEPPLGLSSDFITRKDASAESQLFPNAPETQLQAFYFQPGSNIPQLLAQELGLTQNGLQLSGAPGTRTVFGCSGALRHHIGGDLGTFTFSNQTELLGHWIVALVLELERDWTWDGFKTPGITFNRGVNSIGALTFPRVVGASAVGNPGQKPDRSHTRIVFFDALDQHPAPGAQPDELSAHYSATAAFDAASSETFAFDIRLPITTRPNITPKIVATGLAESAYESFDNYSRTTPRRRYLWIEFDRPLDNPDDAYFGRVLAYGPDPLLAADLLPKLSESEMIPDAVEPPLPIDPEPMRKIFAGQLEDFSGLDAMTQLVAATTASGGTPGNFYLLPLPSGLSAESLELFGFWTYEFRVGHVNKWSTAQGRYGRPVRVAGIQHPSPHLFCAVERGHNRVAVTAPYATTVFNGKRVYDFRRGDPQTRIWFMLYAQVLQADGTTWRNVLLDHRIGITLKPKVIGKLDHIHAESREPHAAISFDQHDIDNRLELLGLHPTAALSVLAVELLPGPLSGRGEKEPAAVMESSSQGANANSEDPLGAQLGLRRILRTSPLIAIPPSC